MPGSSFDTAPNWSAPKVDLATFIKEPAPPKACMGETPSPPSPFSSASVPPPMGFNIFEAAQPPSTTGVSATAVNRKPRREWSMEILLVGMACRRR